MAGFLRGCSGVQSNGSRISLLLVASSDLCDKISESLHTAGKKRKCRLVVHQCESIAQVSNPGNNLSVDFIIFAIDGQVGHSISEIESNLSFIDRNYIVSGSVALVYCQNASDISGMTYHKSRELSKKYCLRKFLNADVQNLDNCNLLAERLLNIAESVLGFKTGFPNCTA